MSFILKPSSVIVATISDDHPDFFFILGLGLSALTVFDSFWTLVRKHNSIRGNGENPSSKPCCEANHAKLAAAVQEIRHRMTSVLSFMYDMRVAQSLSVTNNWHRKK